MKSARFFHSGAETGVRPPSVKGDFKSVSDSAVDMSGRWGKSFAAVV
jgi:hypothetical protein